MEVLRDREARRGRPDEADQPNVYARRIAYLPDASTIRARTVDMFGEGRTPSLEKCQAYRDAYLYEREKFRADCEARTSGSSEGRLPEPQQDLRNEALVAAYLAGKTLEAVAKESGLSPRTVHTVIKAAGASRTAGLPKLAFKSPEQRKEYIKLRDCLGAETARKAIGL